MATGTNGIITRGEVNALLPYGVSGTFFTSELTKCPTMQEITNVSYQTADWSYRVNIGDSINYTSDQLVKASSCTLIAIQKSMTIHVTMQSITGESKPFTNDWVLYENNTYQKDCQFLIDVDTGSIYLQSESVSFTMLADKVNNQLTNFRVKNTVEFTVKIAPSTQVRMELGHDAWYSEIIAGQVANITIPPGTLNAWINWDPIILKW